MVCLSLVTLTFTPWLVPLQQPQPLLTTILVFFQSTLGKASMPKKFHNNSWKHSQTCFNLCWSCHHQENTWNEKYEHTKVGGWTYVRWLPRNIAVNAKQTMWRRITFNIWYIIW